MERFSIPAVGGIIEKEEHGIKYVLIQERVKSEAPSEKGLIEIPAGKTREFENVFDCLRREVFEETGLEVTEITGEVDPPGHGFHGYRVIGFEPFYVSQNLMGSYPIIVLTFLCRAKGDLLIKSDESENLRWITVTDLAEELRTNVERFYPMHVTALKKYAMLYAS